MVIKSAIFAWHLGQHVSLNTTRLQAQVDVQSISTTRANQTRVHLVLHKSPVSVFFFQIAASVTIIFKDDGDHPKQRQTKWTDAAKNIEMFYHPCVHMKFQLASTRNLSN